MNNFNSCFKKASARLLSGLTVLASAAIGAQTLTVAPVSLDFGKTDIASGQYPSATRPVFPTLSVTYTNGTAATINLLSLSGGPSASAGNNSTFRFTTSGSCYSGATIDAPLRTNLAPGAACSIAISPNYDVLAQGFPSLGGFVVDDVISLVTSAGTSSVSIRATMGRDLRFYSLGGALQADPWTFRLSRPAVSAASDIREVKFINPHQTGTTYVDTINFVAVPSPFARSGGTCPTTFPATATHGCTMLFSVPANALPAITSPISGTAVIGFARANRAIDLILDTGIPGITSDVDGDGIPYAVEIAEGRDPGVKDNAIFTGLNANSNRWFAMQQYRDFLGREAEATGLASWTTLLNMGTPREDVIQSFFNSPEFQLATPSVVRLYLGFFKRIPDSAGLKGWVSAVRAGSTLSSAALAFAQSAEFQLTYGALTNPQFITLVYNNVLGRAPDTAGFNHWLALLQGGMSRGEMMLGFTDSAEFQLQTKNNVFVIMMYEGLLRRAAEQAGYEHWVNYANGGKDALDLTRGFLGSTEYRLRFLPQ
jgi:hypothetical protein